MQTAIIVEVEGKKQLVDGNGIVLIHELDETEEVGTIILFEEGNE